MTSRNCPRFQRCERVFPALLLTVTMTGCASQSGYDTAPVEDIAASAHPDLITNLLFAQHAEWGGTRYRFGGVDKSGIDCSAFTSVTFATRFGIRLPRTTAEQVKLGAAVPRRALRPGDLIFFKTGIQDRHVGIYAGNRQFLHASTSRGVTLSSLDNPYWRNRFWQARRIEI